MHPLVNFVMLFIYLQFESAEMFEIVHAHYKKRYLPVDSYCGSLKEESTPDILTCSLLCRGDRNCCRFFYNVSNSHCVLQGGDVKTPPSKTCNEWRVWYIEKTEGDRYSKVCLEGHRDTHEAQTEKTILQQESTMGISHTGAPASFQHIQNMTLHQACLEGRLDEVKYILSTGLQNINCRNKKGFTPVMTAAWKKQEAVFDFLVRRGCNLSLATYIGNNVLHMACDGGNADIVSKLIDEHKFDIDCRGCTGWTPVMYAAYFGHRGIVDLLASKGCHLTAVDDHKRNLLHAACLGGFVDVVKYIITLKMISLESRDNAGRTPVLTAAVMGHVDVVTLLESYGCQMRVTDYKKRNILHTACFGDQEDLAKHLLKMNFVGVDSKDAKGQTPILIAAKMGLIEVVKQLELKRSNLRTVTADGNNLLHAACVGGHVDMVKHILKQNIISIETRGVYGRTPVLMAAGMGHIRVVDILRMKKCNLRTADNYKSNILHIACLGGHVDMVKYILKLNVVGIESRGYNGETAVMGAARMGYVEVIKVLRSKQCNLGVIDKNKNNILNVACFGGHIDVVKYILKVKAVDIESRGCNGDTAVMSAVRNGQVGIVDLLRRKGCDMKTLDIYGNTILHVACQDGRLRMVRFLLRLNIVSRRRVNKGGFTPSQMARNRGHGKVVTLLNTGK